jgi:hypothetical protein
MIMNNDITFTYGNPAENEYSNFFTDIWIGETGSLQSPRFTSQREGGIDSENCW